MQRQKPAQDGFRTYLDAISKTLQTLIITSECSWMIRSLCQEFALWHQRRRCKPVADPLQQSVLRQPATFHSARAMTAIREKDVDKFVDNREHASERCIIIV